MPQLLRETDAIDHLVCRGPLEAAVREIRLIQALQPRFNRQAKVWRKYAYVKLTNERFPRLTVTRAARDDGSTYLGPLPSTAAAHLVREAIESAVPLRRCPRRLPKRFTPEPGAPCVPAQLGVATCPCRGQIDDAGYAESRTGAHRARLRSREPAGSARETHDEPRGGRTVRGGRRDARPARRAQPRDLAPAHGRPTARAAASLVVDGPEGRLELRHGRLVLADGPGSEQPQLVAPINLSIPPARDEIDELLVVARHLGKTAASLRLERAAGTYASVLPLVPAYESTRAASARRSSRRAP